MNNVLLWFGGLLVALLCALFAVPHFVDWTRYRGVFEEEASRVLGREVRVAGAVNLRLLPTPYVRFEKVRLSDVAGQTGEPFFRADDFTLWLAPGPLLRGAIEAREVELRRPTLKLRLNAQGGGNWQTLSIARGALPFVPSDVALQSVLISDGTISVDGADGQELLRTSGITGELSVAALEGPFRFKGAVDWGGSRHDLRLATTAMETDGGLRLKSQVGSPATGNSYTFDGRLSDLSGHVKLDGQVVGQLAFAPSNIGSAAPDVPASASGTSKRIPVELRLNMAIDADGGKFTDINMSFDQNGKPQLLTGAAQVGWRGKLVAHSEFAARWLDLDGVLAEVNTGKPLDVMRRLTPLLGHLVPNGGQGRSSVSVDQATVGGESLGDVHLQVERDDVALKLIDFRVNLPGATRVALNGSLPANDAFDGEISLRGTNLARLMTWLGYAAAVPESRTDGAFSLKSKLAFDRQSVSIREASASLGTAMITGGIGYRWTGRPRFDIVLEGDQIDLGLISPRALNLMLHARRLTGGGAPASAPQAAVAKSAPAAPSPALADLAIDPHTQDATLQIRAGRLIDAERDLRDVDVDAAIINGRLTLKRMRLLSGTGLELEAEGEIADLGSRQRGGLRGTVAVADESAVAELLELFDQPEDGAAFKRLRPLAPARVAFTAKFGDGSKEAAGTSAPVPVDIWLDGAALGRRLTTTARFEGGLRDWRQGQLQLNAAIERPDWPRLRRLVAVEAMTTSQSAAGAPSGARGRLLLKLIGRPEQALNAFVKLDDDAFDAGLSGRVTLGADTITAADGELQLRTSDAASALTTLGLQLRNLPGLAIEGTANVALKDDTWKIVPSALEVGGTQVAGELNVARLKDSDRHRIDGRLTAPRVVIPRLLDLLCDAPPAAASVREAHSHIWQSAAFDFSALERVEGRLQLETAELALGADLSLAKAMIDVGFVRGKVEVSALGGEVMGGRLSSNWTLEKVPAGASLTGRLELLGAQLGALGQAAAKGAPRLGGTAALSATVSGRGTSPRGLLSALTGKGEIEVVDGQVSGLAPLLVRRLSEDVIGGKREPNAEAVAQGVAAMLASVAPEARLALGNRKIGFDIADDAAKIRPFAVETGDGRASNRTTVDLASLMIDSEWKIEQRGEPAAASSGKAVGPLPPVTIVFVGPAAALGRLAPTITVDALLRELVVRRMERDVEELERLRRLDEERVKAEAERKRAEEAARAAATAAAAAAAAVGPLVPGVAAPVQIAPGLAPAASPAGSESQAAAAEAPPAGAAAATPEPTPAPAQKQRGISTEPRQVPSSQQLKKQQLQEVFKRQELGGN